MLTVVELALLDLDAERSTLYRDILSEALSEAARRELGRIGERLLTAASLEEVLGNP